MRALAAALLALGLTACAPDWENPMAPPDGGKTRQPMGQALMCTKHPDHAFCR